MLVKLLPIPGQDQGRVLRSSSQFRGNNGGACPASRDGNGQLRIQRRPVESLKGRRRFPGCFGRATVASSRGSLKGQDTRWLLQATPPPTIPTTGRCNPEAPITERPRSPGTSPAAPPRPPGPSVLRPCQSPATEIWLVHESSKAGPLQGW